VHLLTRLRRLFLGLAGLAVAALAAAPAIGHGPAGAAALQLAEVCSAGPDAPLVPGGTGPHCAQGLPCCGAAPFGPPPCPAAPVPASAQRVPAERGARPASRAGRWRRQARAPPA
jgi:hypothetical protein